MNVQIINKSEHPMPDYATALSAGFDIRANTDGVGIYLKPGERKLIPTGLYMAIPEGCELQIRPRSGIAYKNGVTVLNSPGTIDADYRDEIKVLLINHGESIFAINDGDRIAQGVFAKHEKAVFQKVKELGETERKGGFGSTGVE